MNNNNNINKAVTHGEDFSDGVVLWFIHREFGSVPEGQRVRSKYKELSESH